MKHIMKGAKFMPMDYWSSKIWLRVDFTSILIRKMKSYVDHSSYSYFTAMC